MDKMWAGRFLKELSSDTNDFNSSIAVDSRMYVEDIRGSIAHALMLGAKGIIPEKDSLAIIRTLKEIEEGIENGTVKIDAAAEDIHMFVEAELTKRLGDVGKRLHTARSRNDQVALDTRLYCVKEIKNIKAALIGLLKCLVSLAEKNVSTIMPGYTHLQRAQPVSFAHYMTAYASMFARDCDRLDDCLKRVTISPLGSCALAGTTYDIDRFQTAESLGFAAPSVNSMDGVSDRDFAIELTAAISLIMTHLSRFCEEIIMWCSWEFRFIELDDAYSTGSSIMPQKKNPDIAELVRGKTGRVYGDLMALLTVMKGLPLAYNKDMQEDKESLFDAIDTVKLCLPIFTKMLDTCTINKDNMLKAAGKGFINATDCADYLVKKGKPFRDAYKITGELVAKAISLDKTLSELGIEDYKEKCDLFDKDVYDAIELKNCLNKRNSYGGAGEKAVAEQIKYFKEFIEKNA